MYLLRDSIGYLEIAIPVALFLWLIYWLINRTVDNQQHWHHTFDGEHFSSEEFFASVTEHIKKREIPDIEFFRIIYPQSGTLSDDREYLHIQIREHMYDVCAAPYGNCYFVSLWYAEKHSVFKKLLKMIPILKSLLQSKTYYRIDTDSVANNVVYTSFNEAIDALTTAKGFRAMTKSEMKIALN